MALHDWDSKRGLALWQDFSSRSTKYDEAVCDEKWATFSQGGGLTVGTIFKEALRNGWQFPEQRARKKASTNNQDEDHTRGTEDTSRVESTEDDEDSSEDILDRWPKIDSHAFYGIAGEIANKADPHSEADKVATLVQLLVAFGSMTGRSAHFVVGATRHYLNLFAALVGPTAVGRKGTSWDVARMILRGFDPVWNDTRIQSGLVSGEGLIYHVRDARTEEHKAKAPSNGSNGKPKNPWTTGADPRFDTVVVDPGVKDKRLLVIETELSRTLKAMNRESNTLSDVIRQAWDSGDLRILAKNHPAVATGAHVSIIGHVTQADVRKHLTETDSANGFANRFAWVAVRRSKELPEGGNLYNVDWSDINRRMRPIVDAARECGTMQRDPGARKIWQSVYQELSSGKVGLLGAVLSRAEAQTMRLACLYALLDGSVAIRAEHLTAALALWDYCEQSARLVFGDALGNADAEKLLGALKTSPEGLTRKQITVDVFCKNKKREAINTLLSDLLTQGMIDRVTEAKILGRPVERWRIGRGGNSHAN
jgi:hypothetical protein